MKNCVHTSKLGLQVEFFVVTIIDIHQFILGPLELKSFG
jgi:hypothetical protein